MKPYHEVKNIRFESDRLKIEIDGKSMEFRLAEISEELLRASALERETFEISPSGYGIQWPLLDENLFIDAC
jgi:hypothetical protein